MANPIWKDYYVNLGTAESVQFRILVGGDVIYTGKAFKRPGQSTNQIRINDICADYLQYTFPELVGTTFTGGEHITFVVQINNGYWSTVASIQFDNDWSYDYDYNPATMGMSFPVNGHIDIRQWILFSEYEESAISATIKLKDGESFDVTIPVEMDEAFDAENDFSLSIKASQTGTAVFSLSQWGDVELITIGNRVYKVVNPCNRYVLYYVNAYGGWDSLLIEGNYSEVDNLTRHIRETGYNNRDVQNRGSHNYVNEIVKSLTLHTSWLSDDESSRMHHLLNSTNVYLGDITSGAMIPVVLTGTQTEYKTYKGNGGRLVNYSINVTIAQEKSRR